MECQQPDFDWGKLMGKFQMKEGHFLKLEKILDITISLNH